MNAYARITRYALIFSAICNFTIHRHLDLLHVEAGRLPRFPRIFILDFRAGIYIDIAQIAINLQKLVKAGLPNNVLYATSNGYS